MFRRVTSKASHDDKERTGGMKAQRVTIHTLRQMKERGEKIAVLTAYDATFARLFDEAGIDVLLVGDSLGMVVQGNDTTLPVTREEMAYHCRAVVGAGAACDGQVLVSYDMLGMDETFKPRFVRRFATLGATIKQAVGQYAAEVRAATFPSDAESFALNETRPQGPDPALYSTAAAK